MFVGVGWYDLHKQDIQHWFCILSNEDTPSFAWVLTKLRDIYVKACVMPTAIMTNRDQSLINAVHEVFTEEVQHMLC